MMSGWKAEMVRRSCHHARGSSPISHAVPCTVVPSAAARRASSPVRLLKRTCSIAPVWRNSRHSSRTWFWPPRHSRPESTWSTRIWGLAPNPSLLHSGEYAAQCIELEGLLQEGTAQLFEELERVAADRVARRENDTVRDRRVHARERVEHLATAEPGHPQVADDQVERLHQRPLQRLAAIVRQHDLVPPAFERRLHIVEDVRLVIDHEHAQLLLPLRGSRFGFRPAGERAALGAHARR